MQQIKSVICRQACVACSSEVLMKNNEMSVYYFLLEAIFRCILGLLAQINIRVFNQSGQSDLIMIAIWAERKNKNITPTTYFHFWKVRRNVFGDAK